MPGKLNPAYKHVCIQRSSECPVRSGWLASCLCEEAQADAEVNPYYTLCYHVEDKSYMDPLPPSVYEDPDSVPITLDLLVEKPETENT